MPTPPKTSTAKIIATARDLIAERGIDALTMQAVAETVGVRGPSLYKHFADRAALLRAVEQTVVADLENVLAAAARPRDDKSALLAMAAAYRRFARKSPEKYALIFGLHSGDAESETARRRALQPALRRLEFYFGDRDLAFIRARVLTAFLHGFVSMEAAGAFRLGGNIDDAFSAGIEILLTRSELR
jgi:AcrR family transcriptional regulator